MEKPEELTFPDWCCTVCAARFGFLKIRMRAGALHCPECDASSGLQPIGDPTVLDEYVGEKGSLQ